MDGASSDSDGNCSLTQRHSVIKLRLGARLRLRFVIALNLSPQSAESLWNETPVAGAKRERNNKLGRQ